MKNKLYFTFTLLTITTVADAATVSVPWWSRPTICKISTKNCYPNMGNGFDTEMWDANNNCWGMKIICADAMIDGAHGDAPMGRNEIAAHANINIDYDTDVLNGGCFGARATKNNGAMVSINGKYVPVWCSGILHTPDDFVAGGEIIASAPTCAELARDGYVAVTNGNCFGKYFDPNDYFIDCANGGNLPTRIVVLNGADISGRIVGGAPYDRAAADAIFREMYSVSATKHAEHFK
ncbi:MAG: hypothetical protein IJ560_04180 [Alphaproteobacteria bacterium]|nr:hypothetical protein [Alphaproteobacteria bacterium]